MALEGLRVVRKKKEKKHARTKVLLAVDFILNLLSSLRLKDLSGTKVDSLLWYWPPPFHPTGTSGQIEIRWNTNMDL
jgi:hypothetical protein